MRPLQAKRICRRAQSSNYNSIDCYHHSLYGERSADWLGAAIGFNHTTLSCKRINRPGRSVGWEPAIQITCQVSAGQIVVAAARFLLVLNRANQPFPQNERQVTCRSTLRNSDSDINDRANTENLLARPLRAANVARMGEICGLLGHSFRCPGVELFMGVISIHTNERERRPKQAGNPCASC